MIPHVQSLNGNLVECCYGSENLVSHSVTCPFDGYGGVLREKQRERERWECMRPRSRPQLFVTIITSTITITTTTTTRRKDGRKDPLHPFSIISPCLPSFLSILHPSSSQMHLFYLYSSSYSYSYSSSTPLSHPIQLCYIASHRHSRQLSPRWFLFPILNDVPTSPPFQSINC